MSLALPTPQRGPSARTVAACAAAIAAGSVALGASGLSGVQALKPGRPSLLATLLLRGRILLDARALAGGLPRGTIVPPVPARPFVLKASSVRERERAVRCLGNAVYYEAGNEPEAGQRAVAQVVLNRLRDPNFPKSICGVVYQGWERQTGCQFSFTCDGSLVRAPPDADRMARARGVAEEALGGRVAGEVGTATHYHANYVSPWWKAGVTRVAQIGAHIFYRWPGVAGTLAAFTGRYQGGETRLSEAVLSGRAPRPVIADSAPDPTVIALQKIVVADAGAPGGVRHRIRAIFALEAADGAPPAPFAPAPALPSVAPPKLAPASPPAGVEAATLTPKGAPEAPAKPPAPTPAASVSPAAISSPSSPAEPAAYR